MRKGEIRYDNNKFMEEDEGANLRNFHEEEDLKKCKWCFSTTKRYLKKLFDQIWNEGFDNIFYIGIGGTYASAMQVEVYMRGRSKLPVYVENAAEFLTTGNKRFTNKSIAILSSVSGNTLEMIELVDKVHEIGGKVFSFIDTPKYSFNATG